MHHNEHDDPDSGHPTPRDEFNPEEATTSTPISARLRPSGARNSPASESFSPRLLFSSPRLTQSHSNDYNLVADVIEIVKKKKALEVENDMMRNLSMRSEQELDESRARIAELEEQRSVWDDSTARISDLEEQAKFFTPTIDLRTGEIAELEEKWMEERRLMEKEKEEMEVRLREELDAERKKVDELKEWQLKCEMVETENGLISKRTASSLEKKDALLREKDQELELLRARLQEVDRLSIASSDSSNFNEMERVVKEMSNAISGQELVEARDAAAEEMKAIDDLRRRNGELEGRLEECRKEIEELQTKMDEERRTMSEAFELEKDEIMKRATSVVERQEGLLKEKEEEMKEDMRRKEVQVEEMMEEVQKKEMEMEKEKNELVELRMKVKENAKVVGRIEQATVGVERKIEEKEKEMEELRKKIAEMESQLSVECKRLRGLEQTNAELEKKITVADQALIEANRRYEDLKTVREVTIHQQQSMIDNLERVIGELEETKKQSGKIMNELREKKDEGKKMRDEIDQLKKDVEQRKDSQKRLEDELDIARKRSEDADREVKRVKKEHEKEMEKRRMEFKNKELRVQEEAKKAIEEARNEARKCMSETLIQVNESKQHYEELQQQFQELQALKVEDDYQYQSELASKEDELFSVRERLAELENYPGLLVSVDGGDSAGRSVYDLLPTQIKDFIDQTTNESVRRSVEFCKSLVVRGEVEETTPSYLPFLIGRLEEIEMRTATFKQHRDLIVRIFKNLEEEEGSEELMTSLAARLDGSMADLEEEWMRMEKIIEQNEERLRRSEDERMRMEDEVMQANEGKTKMQTEMMTMRDTMQSLKDEIRSLKNDHILNENAAIEFKELYDLRCSELKDADEELDELKERYQRLLDQSDEKDRKIRMQHDEYIEVETKFEAEIERNRDLSRKLIDESSEVHKLEEAKRRLKKDLDKVKLKKHKQLDMIREYMDALRKHFDVYQRVKGRSIERHYLLDDTVAEIEKTRKEMEKMNAGVSRRLEKLESKIRASVLDFLAKDEADYRESDKLRTHIDSLREENKENHN